MSNEKEEKKHSGFTDSVIGASTTENIERFGRASAEFLKGYKGTTDELGNTIRKGLKEISGSKVHPDYEYINIKQQSGFSAEVNYVDKKNAENIIKRDNTRIHRSNDIGRGNDTQFDVLSVDELGNPTWGAQMKFCGKFGSIEEINNSSRDLVNKLASDKWERYRGNKILVPEEQFDVAKKYAEETSQNLSQQSQKFREQGNIEKANLLEKKSQIYKQISMDIENSGITSKEAIFLREHPKLATAKYVAQTAHRSGMENAKGAAVISGTISTAQNVVAVVKGDKDGKEAIKSISKDTLNGAVTGYIIGAGDTAIRGFMASSKSSVFVNLSKSSMPAMIAGATVQVGKSLIRYANGEINSLELIEELGEKGTGMMAASFGAAVGTMVFPGIGTVVGGMVGYMVSSTMYNASLQVLRNERFSKERRDRIHAIANAAIEAMRIQGNELLLITNQFYENRREIFESNISAINQASISGNIEQFTEGLNNIAIEMGEVLQFKNFQEFDIFMMDKQSVFKF